MPISRTDHLVKLIESLTKSEKRNFRLYARRIQDSGSLMYLHLFDLLDNGKPQSEAALRKRLGDISRSQLSNLKRHLYSQILSSLRLVHRRRQIPILIHEYLDFAQVLYGKGLYMQSLKLFEKARKLAEKNHEDFSALMIVELQKTIESRHITRSGPVQSERLIEKANALSDSIYNRIKLSNLRILLHGLYVRRGHLHNAKEKEWLRARFEENLSHVIPEKLGTWERIHLYQSYVWYYYILQDFERCAEYAGKWIGVFEDAPELIERDVDLYMRGLHYMLTAEYNLRNIEQYEHYLDEFEKFRKDTYPRFNTNSQIISFLYVHYGRLNKHFLHGTFEEGLEVVPRTLRRIRRYRDKLDAHRIMVFYFKIAWMYLGAGRPDRCIDYLNKITELDLESLREDIQCYARLMLLIAHYELESYDVITYLLKQVQNFFEKVNEINDVQKRTLRLFKELVKAPLGERTQIMQKCLDDLRILEQEQYAQRAFLYLDVTSWLEAKVRKVSLGEAVRERFE